MECYIKLFNATKNTGPIVVLRGADVVKKYYLSLLNELAQNIDQGINFLETEVRQFWNANQAKRINRCGNIDY